MAKLYGVGVGPGDPELMTLKAVKLIESCDIIAVPRSGQTVNVAYTIAKGAYPDLDKKRIEELDMPMVRDRELWNRKHDEAAAQVMTWLDEGKDVVFLTLGDPTIYSTYSYVHNRVRDAGYETQIIPGIPSFCAVAARLNCSLTEAEEALHVIPASYEGLEESLEMPGTKVLMKSGKAIGKVKEYIKSMESQPSVKMVERCGMEGERVFQSVDEIDEESSYFSVLIVRDQRK